ncbi:MAG: carboxypeptidase regulatory-like domain-containing protein [Planctomycetia bacterium]|nr:carboxypeptidase regulatory-like domain-containing protein [Planctomycetia bacterium]
MLGCLQRPGQRARVRAIAIVALLAAASGGHGLARAGDAPPNPPAAPAADPLVEQSEAPWDDRAALDRWFDETCTVVEEIVGEKFRRRPTLRVVTRWELEFVLRENLVLESPRSEAIADRYQRARDSAAWESFVYDPWAHVVCFAPKRRANDRAHPPAGYFPDRLRCVSRLTFAWQAERFEWARPGPAPVGFEASTSLQAVREGHGIWVASLVSRRWGAPDVVPRWLEWQQQFYGPLWSAPSAAGFEFFRRVASREGTEGIRRVLASPPRRLRDVDAPDEWLHPPPNAPPYLDLWSVSDALLAPLPRPYASRLRPRAGFTLPRRPRPPRPADVPVDATWDERRGGRAGQLDVAILQFRDAAAANRFAVAAAAEAPTSAPSDVSAWLRATSFESVEDGAGPGRRARGVTIAGEYGVPRRPAWSRRGGEVVVGPLVGWIEWTGTREGGPEADGLLAALESRLHALLRGERVVAVESYPTRSGTSGRGGPEDDDLVRLEVLVRRPDGTPVAGAAVRVDEDDPASTGSEAWPGPVQTRADGRATVSGPSRGLPLRVRATPPIECDTLAATERTVTGTAPVELTLAEGWVATGRLPVEDRDAADVWVVAWTSTGGRVEVGTEYDGSFRVPQLPMGPVTLHTVRGERFEGPSRISGVGTASPANPFAAFDPSSPPDAGRTRVRLVVRGPEGTPAMAVRVADLPHGGAFVAGHVQTAPSGEILATYTPTVRRLFVLGAALADGRRLAPRTVLVPLPPVDRLVVGLDLAVVTFGRVLDAGGRGVPGARVEGGIIGSPWVAAEATTDATGAFRLDGLAAGPCWLAVVETPSSLPSAPPVRAIAGASDLVLRLRSVEDVVVSVVDAAGAPVVGADVYFTPDRRRGDPPGPMAFFGATSDVAGRATLRSVPVATTGKLDVRPPIPLELAPVVRERTRLTASETVRLPASYTVSGRVERDGAGVPGADVFLVTRSGTAPEAWLDLHVKTDPDGRFVVPHVPLGRAVLRLLDRPRWDRPRTLTHDPVALASPEHPVVVLRASHFADVSFRVDGAAARAMSLHAVGLAPGGAEITADASGRFDWIGAADVPHELWIPPTPEDPRVAYLPDYVPGPRPPTLTLTAPGVARFRRPAFEGGQVDGATVEDAWVVGPMGMAFAARLVAEGRFEVDGLPPGTFPAVVRVRTGQGWVRCTGPVTVGAPEVELPRP